MRRAILLAAFGSTRPGGAAAVAAMLDRVRREFPDLPAEVAYTSATVRRHHRQGPAARSVDQALQDLAARGFDAVALQSLHLIPGREFHDLLALARKRAGTPGWPARIEPGFPLLAADADIEAAAEAVLAHLPALEPGQAAVLMGHGTGHPAADYYPALAEALRRRDPRVFLGAMESGPGLEEVLAGLAAGGHRSCLLAPLLFGAGAHAEKDLSGEDERSWMRRLERAGIACRVEMQGLGEMSGLADIWIGHLRDALARLGS